MEYGASLKNVYAIAAGCCDGLGLGDNAKAALMTRAVAEMVRVGASLGARRETFYGLSGFGDLVATCHGLWSRNREFGQKIGEGRHIAELLAGRRTVVEGYETTRSFAGLCAERRIDAPILLRDECDPLPGAPAGRRYLGPHDARAQARVGARSRAGLSRPRRDAPERALLAGSSATTGPRVCP